MILSLGSNLGDRLSFLQRAVDELAKLGKISKCSSVYESPAWGFESEQSFYNICIELETDLGPQKLLIRNQEIERELGRIKKGKERYESRVIDIDIIFYDDIIFHSNLLQIPHPEYQNRGFVMFPLLEIAENRRDPKSGKLIEQIIEIDQKVTSIKPINRQIFINI